MKIIFCIAMLLVAMGCNQKESEKESENVPEGFCESDKTYEVHDYDRENVAKKCRHPNPVWTYKYFYDGKKTTGLFNNGPTAEITWCYIYGICTNCKRNIFKQVGIGAWLGTVLPIENPKDYTQIVSISLPLSKEELDAMINEKSNNKIIPRQLTEKKYYYEVRCTCGLLFERNECNQDMDGRISHTICYDCLLKTYEGTAFIPSKALAVRCYIDTEKAKMRVA